MRDNKWQWWMIVAVLIAAGEAVLSIGNVVAYLGDDTRSLSSSMIAAAGGLLFATLIIGGLLLRRGGRPMGSVAAAAGALPGCVGLMFWWFPPRGRCRDDLPGRGAVRRSRRLPGPPGGVDGDSRLGAAGGP